MLIANPIYDTVFKYLMDDNRIAKLIISTIIDEEIAELEFRPQERTSISEKFPVQVYRLDFTAKIKTKKGDYKNILIEIQKAKFPADIMRFRKYLGEQYQKAEIVKKGKKEYKTALPIITIYFLGFEIDGIDAQAVKINRTYINAITGAEIKKRNDFIEKLTHNSYVIQIPRLKPQRRNRLEELLSIFDQSGVKDDPYTLDLKYELPEEFLRIVRRLEQAILDKELREKLELTDEIDSFIESKEREYIEKLEEKDKKLEEKDKKLEEKDKLINELQKR